MSVAVFLGGVVMTAVTLGYAVILGDAVMAAVTLVTMLPKNHRVAKNNHTRHRGAESPGPS